jgi:hypothetical protein
MTELPKGCVRITKVKGVEFDCLYYDRRNSTFYTRRRSGTKLFFPIKQKCIFRPYRNARGDLEYPYEYKYYNLYNFRTKNSLRINVDEWLEIWDEMLEKGNNVQNAFEILNEEFLRQIAEAEAREQQRIERECENKIREKLLQRANPEALIEFLLGSAN